jgi:hypothetical protein
MSVAVFATLLVSGVPHAATAQRVAPAETGGAHLSWRIDGIATQAHESRVREPVEAAVARERAAWRAERPDEPVNETAAGPWRVLGQRAGRSFRVAQFAADAAGTTRIVRSSRELGAARAAEPAELPLPPGSRVIRRLEMAQTAGPVVQVYALSAEPPPLAEVRLDAAARRAGWDPVPASHRRYATTVRAWRRGADELLVVTTPLAAGTGLLLHLAPRARETAAP